MFENDILKDLIFYVRFASEASEFQFHIFERILRKEWYKWDFFGIFQPLCFLV